MTETTRVVVFDVGGTFIKYGVVEDGRLGEMGKIPTPQDSQESFLQALEAKIQELAAVRPLVGVAFSLPGIIDVDKRYMYAGGALGYNNGTDITAWEERFGVPVEVFNDAKASALAELTLGSMQGVKNGIVATFGTGVGGAVIVDGKVVFGPHLMAGEISVALADDLECGHMAYLGNVAGTGFIARAIGEATGHDITTGEEAFELIAAGDERAIAVFNDRCDKVVRTFYNYQILIDPERFAIGGGVSANPLFIQGLEDAADRLCAALPYPIHLAEIVPCRFRNASNLIGAYLHFAQKRGLSTELDVEDVA